MRGFLAILIAIIALVWVGCEPTGGAVNAEDKEPHFLEGRRQMQQRDFEGAERSFHKALEANPRSALAHYEIGLLYLTRKSDPAAAIYHLQRYLSLKPNAPKGKVVQGQIEALKGDLARGYTRLAPARTRFGHSTTSYAAQPNGRRKPGLTASAPIPRHHPQSAASHQ